MVFLRSTKYHNLNACKGQIIMYFTNPLRELLCILSSATAVLEIGVSIENI